MNFGDIRAARLDERLAVGRRCQGSSLCFGILDCWEAPGEEQLVCGCMGEDLHLAPTECEVPVQ